MDQSSELPIEKVLIFFYRQIPEPDQLPQAMAEAKFYEEVDEFTRDLTNSWYAYAFVVGVIAQVALVTIYFNLIPLITSGFPLWSVVLMMLITLVPISGVWTLLLITLRHYVLTFCRIPKLMVKYGSTQTLALGFGRTLMYMVEQHATSRTDE